jgi:hypothetical protein
MKAIKLSVLIEALEFDSEEHVTQIDLQEGCVMSVERFILSAVEENDEKVLEELLDWQKPEVETARAIVADASGRFVAGPEKFDFHEYRQMERFIGTVADAGVAEQLWRAIKGKGAFRHFKDTAARLGLLKRWYAYRDEAMKEFVMGWAEAKGIPIVDGPGRSPGRTGDSN